MASNRLRLLCFVYLHAITLPFTILWNKRVESWSRGIRLIYIMTLWSDRLRRIAVDHQMKVSIRLFMSEVKKKKKYVYYLFLTSKFYDFQRSIGWKWFCCQIWLYYYICLFSVPLGHCQHHFLPLFLYYNCPITWSLLIFLFRPNYRQIIHFIAIFFFQKNIYRPAVMGLEGSL